jgi:hypothetical protein
MCLLRRSVRLLLSLAAIAVLVAVVRARRSVEVWHVAADEAESTGQIPADGDPLVG